MQQLVQNRLVARAGWVAGLVIHHCRAINLQRHTCRLVLGNLVLDHATSIAHENRATIAGVQGEAHLNAALGHSSDAGLNLLSHLTSILIWSIVDGVLSQAVYI